MSEPPNAVSRAQAPVFVSAADEDFIQHYAVMLTSLVNTLETPQGEFYLLTAHLTDETKQKLYEHASALKIKLNLVDIEGQLDQIAKLPVTGHVSLATYARFLLPRCLPDTIRKVLYLDVDLLVLADISPLFQVELADAYAVAAVSDPLGERMYRAVGLKSAAHYFNAGVLLINLDRWRQEAIGEKAIRYAEENSEELQSWDQCALNAVLKDKVLYLPLRWNVQEKATPRSKMDALEPRIVHFTGRIKPWHFVSEQQYKSLYRCYLRKTPWTSYVPPDRTAYRVALKLVPRRLKNALKRFLQRSRPISR